MLDWDDLRFFLAIARHGSLTAAAKDLRVAQSTVGRRLASLEENLSVRLLHKTPDGYRLTLAGEAVRSQAERVEVDALTIERAVGGHDAKLEGVVRVSCTETLAVHVLAPCFVALQHRHPEIRVELVPNPLEVSLAMREADLPVRMAPSDRNDLVVRRVGRVAFGLYASPLYLQRHGQPDFSAGCTGHRLMTSLDDVEGDDQERWVARLASCARPGLQTSSHEALVVAARSGGGLACLARFRADRDPALTRLQTPTQPPPAEVCILIHKTAARLLGSGRRRPSSPRRLEPSSPTEGTEMRPCIVGRQISAASRSARID